MPTYCFQNEKTGLIIERMFRIGKAPQRIEEAGRRYGRCFAAEAVGVPAKGWPLTCVASGVQPDQAGELSKCLADAGVPTEVTSQGDPVYRDVSHRKKALKARGFFDKASYS
jgi:hypothetical protein